MRPVKLLTILFILSTALIFAQRVDTVAPGNKALALNTIRPYSVTYSFTMKQGETKRDMGGFKEELSFKEITGEQYLVRVQNVGGDRAIDSSIANAATLVPLYHSGTNRGGIMTLHFGNDIVTGKKIIKPKDSLVVINMKMAQPYFDSNLIDLVVRMLPLKDGYQAKVPTFLYESGGLAWLDIKAVESTEFSGKTWRVDTEFGGKKTTFWINKETRDLMKLVSYPAPGIEMTMERQ